MGSRRKSLAMLARATAEVCRFEALEHRQLLTTLSGGDTFDYKDSNNDLYRITLRGNVQAEFVGAAVDDANNVTLGDLAAWDAPDGEGRDLFHVYVRNADWNSSITVEAINRDNNGQVTHTPFTGNITLNVTNARDGRDLAISTNGNTGSAYLGARTVQINGVPRSEDRPITSAGIPGQIGILPRDSGQLTAGLHVRGGENLGKFFFDGTVTGEVDIGGSMNTFYAGNVLTGTTGGAFISATPSATPNNFRVDGDLHNLIVSGSVGTDTDNGLDDPNYLTRFQMRVGGHLGQVDVGDDFVGTVRANTENRYAVNQNQEEVESRGEAPSFVNGFLNDTESTQDNQFHNDTFATAQMLGTVRDGILVEGNLVAIDRNEYRDWVDYYGVSLMAGQTVTVQLTETSGLAGFLNVGVYDPDGRLIATDYSDVDPLALQGEAFRFTADRPGVYRFAVGENGDPDFNGGAGFAPSGHAGNVTYTLDINGAGDLAIGAVMAGNNVFDPEVAINGFAADDGDVGAILAGDTAIFQFKSDGFGVLTGDGSLRTIEAANIGRLQNNAVVGGPDLSINNGNVGLLRSTVGVLGVNPSSMLIPSGDTPRNYQLVAAEGRFQGALIADQKIGTIRAGNMATLAPSVFTVNADNQGGDGVIDLIDVDGDFGTLQGGGPHITTGAKGNVRYINVGGDLFRDEAFGGGRPDLTRFNAGQTATLTDDSGAVLRVAPGSGNTLGVLTYGIRGSGGSAIVRVETNGSVNVNADSRSGNAPAEIGLIISTGGVNPSVNINGKSPVDVLNIRGGAFARIDNNTSGELVNILADSIGTLEAQTLGLAKSSTGAAVLPYDVLIAGAIYPYHQQRTGIVAGDINFAKSYAAMGNLIVSPALADAIANQVDPTVAGLIDPAGNTGTINNLVADSDNKNVANVFEGIVGPIYASGGMRDVTIGEGILPSGNGNVARAGLFAGGQIGTVRGRKGASIRGNVISETGITKIDLINGGSIINANIMVTADLEDSREFVPAPTFTSDNDSVNTPTYEIGSISLTGDARDPRPTRSRAAAPASVTALADDGDEAARKQSARAEERRKAAEKDNARAADDDNKAKKKKKKKKKKKGKKGDVPNRPDRPRGPRGNPTPNPNPNPRPNPGPNPTPNPNPAPSSRTNNQGGIIGSFIGAADIGSTIVKGGNFGIINSTWAVPGNGVIKELNASGYGLRDVIISSGARIEDIIASGNGSATSTNSFTADVRMSETENIDPYFGFAPNTLTDLHSFLGTSRSRTTINGVTESGVIEGVSAVASRDLDSLVAWRLIGSRNNATPTIFNFANKIREIRIADSISRVQIITGALDTFDIGRDVNNLDMTVAGTIRKIDIGGFYDGQSQIRAIGPDGSIDDIFVGRDLNGTMSAENEVGRLRVNGAYNGSVTANGVRVPDS